MTKYECMIIIDGKAEESDVEATFTKFQGIIEASSSEVALEKWGKKKLAYEVRKMHEGFYGLYTFRNDGQGILEIERLLRLDEKVMKYLIVKINEKKIAKLAEERKAKAERRALRAEKRAQEENREDQEESIS